MKKRQKKHLIDEPDVIYFRDIDEYIETLNSWTNNGMATVDDLINALGMKLLVNGHKMSDGEISELLNKVDSLGGNPEVLADAAMIFYERDKKELAITILESLSGRYKIIALCNLAIVAGRKKDRNAQAYFLGELEKNLDDEFSRIEYANALINIMENDPQPEILERLAKIATDGDEMTMYFLERAKKISEKNLTDKEH